MTITIPRRLAVSSLPKRICWICVLTTLLAGHACSSTARITEADTGRVIRARLGTELRIELASNPTTGYRWRWRPCLTILSLPSGSRSLHRPMRPGRHWALAAPKSGDSGQREPTQRAYCSSTVVHGSRLPCQPQNPYGLWSPSLDRGIGGDNDSIEPALGLGSRSDPSPPPRWTWRGATPQGSLIGTDAAHPYVRCFRLNFGYPTPRDRREWKTRTE